VGGEVQLHSVLTLTLDGGQWSTSHPGRFIPGRRPRYPLNRKLGGPQDVLEKKISVTSAGIRTDYSSPNMKFVNICSRQTDVYSLFTTEGVSIVNVTSQSR